MIRENQRNSLVLHRLMIYSLMDRHVYVHNHFYVFPRTTGWKRQQDQDTTNLPTSSLAQVSSLQVLLKRRAQIHEESHLV